MMEGKMKNRNMAYVVVGSFLFCIALCGCAPSKEMSTESIPAAKQFSVPRYLGTWYEIVRMPHWFENGLEKTTATYTMRKDGDIDVLNRGWNVEKSEWKDANGKAWVSDPSKGAWLRVRFFWPFSSDYKVIALDTLNYSYSMVTSGTKDYLWILSRTPQMQEPVYQQLIQQAKDFGFDVSTLHKVSH
jgi:apolipoprotein D and lipocalin family protein